MKTPSMLGKGYIVNELTRLQDRLNQLEQELARAKERLLEMRQQRAQVVRQLTTLLEQAAPPTVYRPLEKEYNDLVKLFVAALDEYGQIAHDLEQARGMLRQLMQ